MKLQRNQREAVWTKDHVLAGLGIAVAILCAILSLFSPEVRRHIGFERAPVLEKRLEPIVVTPSTAQPPPENHKRLQLARSLPAEQLKKLMALDPLPPERSGIRADEMPLQSVSFVDAFDLLESHERRRLTVTSEGLATDFQVIRPASGELFVIVYSDTFTSERLREGIVGPSKYTIYSSAWTNAAEPFSIPLASLQCFRSRQVVVGKSARGWIHALDCEVP